jgi:hypothetical protein
LKKYLTISWLLLAALTISGCSADNTALRSDLNKVTQSQSNLLSEQEQIIVARGTVKEVNEKFQLADANIKTVRELCKMPLSKECMFFIDFNDYLTARMMFNAGRYYAINADMQMAEQLLRDLSTRFTGTTSLSEVSRARLLLEYFTKWDSYSPGWKAYFLGDYAIALKEFMESDDPSSLFEVGHMFSVGDGVPRDTKKASEWYLKAADRGYAPAQFKMGQIYLKGNDVPQNRKEAKKWFEKAADQKFAPAVDALAKLRDIEFMEPAVTTSNP